MVSTAGALVKQIEGVFYGREQGQNAAREKYQPLIITHYLASILDKGTCSKPSRDLHEFFI